MTTVLTLSGETVAESPPRYFSVLRNDAVALAPEPAAVGLGCSVVVIGALSQRSRKKETSSLPMRSGTVQPSRSYSDRQASARPFMAPVVPWASAAKSSSAFTFSWLPE